MKNLDQQEQWHQLTDTYRHMTEEELGRVAEDAFDLVPTAREALQAVISERGLKIQLAAALRLQSLRNLQTAMALSMIRKTPKTRITNWFACVQFEMSLKRSS